MNGERIPHIFYNKDLASGRMGYNEYRSKQGNDVSVARVLKGVNDLFTKNPDIAVEWHPLKNGLLTPAEVASKSNIKVWWVCNLGHEWEARVNDRDRGNGCPYCSGRRVSVGLNDLETLNPDLAKQWHPTLNGNLTPQDVTVSAGVKAHWKCSEGHEWKAAIYSRTSGKGCPVCSGKLVLSGYNDLSTVSPEIASQWHPTKNALLTPQCVSGNSSQKVWWVCSLLHEWETSIDHRSKGTGCPYCSGNAVLIGFNDFATINSKLAEQWHPTKNGSLAPIDVSIGSSKKVWWACDLGHDWEAVIKIRVKGSGCPKCSGRDPIIGSTDLATVDTSLTAQWHPTKNVSLTPQHVTGNSNRKVWWLCNLGHEWEAKVHKRRNGNGCPFCGNKRILIGFNDLLTTHPEIAKQWHPTKNGVLTPQEVTAGSHRKITWLCPLSHEWTVAVVKRFGGTGCPDCCAGKTENNFRQAFEKCSVLDFKSTRIPLVRLSRKFARAQIDMLNNDLKIVIEYDGEWTHGGNNPEGKTLQRKLAEDQETTQALVDVGYKVIRIREQSFVAKLPFIPLDEGYEHSVFQITYKSYGKDKHIIEHLVRKIIEKKSGWFRMNPNR